MIEGAGRGVGFFFRVREIPCGFPCAPWGITAGRNAVGRGVQDRYAEKLSDAAKPKDCGIVGIPFVIFDATKDTMR